MARRARGTGRFAGCIVGSVAIAIAAFLPAHAAAGAYSQPDRVLALTTGDHSELVTALDIQTEPGIAPQVVMSLPAAELGELELGDRLRTSAELEVTTDCLVQEPRCVGNPYDYNPVVSTQLVLAGDSTTTDGSSTIPISAEQQRRCGQARPDREHHCTLVFMWPFLDVAAPVPPCLPASCHVNLVASAYNPEAQPGDKLIVGEDEPDGTTRQDKGRVNVVRLRPDAPVAESNARTRSYFKRTPVVHRLQVGDDTDRNHTVVFSQRLQRLKRGDQLAVWARVDTDISSLPYNVLVKSRLIITGRRPAATVTRLAKRVTSLDGEISEGNGFNCTHATRFCRTLKVGVSSMLAEAAKRSGEPVPLFVNLVVGTMAKRASAAPGDAVEVLRGSLRVIRYPASHRG
jgi:hypothetical protein